MRGSISSIGNPFRRSIEFDQMPVRGQKFVWRDSTGKTRSTELLVSVIPTENCEPPYSSGSVLQDLRQAYMFLLLDPELPERNPK